MVPKYYRAGLPRVDRLRNMATKSLGDTTMRTLTALLMAILCAVPAHAQKKQSQEPPQPQQADEKILHVASNARDQIDSFVEAWAEMLLMDTAKNGGVDAEKATKLINQIEFDTKNQKHWEKTVWTIPHSELFPGEMIESHLGTFLMVEGTAGTCRKRFPTLPEKSSCFGTADTTEAAYVVQAPLDVKAHILMEGIRHGILHWAAIQDFQGKPTDDAFVTSWNTAWFDARNVYCRRSPGSKYFDLSNEEQICK
jgi:hypothetical protein